MPTPCAPRARREQAIRLTIPMETTESAIVLLLSEIRSRAYSGGPKRFALDCSGIPDLPARGLEELAELRAGLRETGSDLALVNCDATLRQALVGGLYAALLGETATRHGAHSLRGPHPAFLRSFRAGA
jgi:hypothetical protein